MTNRKNKMKPRAKTTVENCSFALSVFSLNQKGYLRASNSGTWIWKSVRSISYEINVDRLTPDFSDYSTPYITLSYSILDNQNQQKSINQRFYLSKTLCNFGRFTQRYWFICICGKRVSVLYQPNFSDEFKCRHCYNLTYESRNLSSAFKAVGRLVSTTELDRLWNGIKRFYYKETATKRYRKYLDKARQHMAYWDAWYQQFVKMVERAKKK